MADNSKDLLVGLDIGSSKVVCAVASSISPTSFRIEGLGECKSHGIREGTVVDIQGAVESIRTAVDEASQTAQTNIRNVVAGISGIHIRTDNVTQQLIIKSNEIEQRDIDQLIENSQEGPLAPSMRYLDVIPLEYAVDFNWGIVSPVGMEGKKLEAKLHMITAQSGPCVNLNKAIRRAGLELIDSQLCFNPLAAASALLSPEEKNLGVALIDIGADLTDVAVFSNGVVQYTSVAPFGGQTITDEVAIKTQLSNESAEELKQRLGQVKFDPSTDMDGSFVMPAYPGLGQEKGRVLTKQAFSDIINPRIQDMFENIYYKIRDKGLHNQLSHGVVLTGGGACLPGIDRMAKEVFSMHLAGRDINVRIGRPLISFETGEFVAPEDYSTAVLPSQLTGYSTPQHAAVMGYLYDLNRKVLTQGSRIRSKGKLKTAAEYLKTWFLGNF